MNHVDIHRLLESVVVAEKDIGKFRASRRSAIQDYVGANYADMVYGGDSHQSKRFPVNLVELTVSTLAPYLAPRDPAADVTTTLSAEKPTAADLKFAINAQATELDLGGKMRTLVKDGLLGGLGILKIALERDGSILLNSVHHDVGSLFIEIVSLDDFFWDTSAKAYDAVAFAGNRYKLDLEMVKASESFKNTENLVKTDASNVGVDGEMRATGISREG